MRRYAMGFGITLALLLILGIFAFTQLEIYRKPHVIAPSREARANAYLALDRWLTQTGHPVRIESPGDPRSIITAGEKTVFLQTSCFYWHDKAWETLEPWVLEGGVLILSLDSPWYEDIPDGLSAFLTHLGIQRLDPRVQEGEIGGKIADPLPDFDQGGAFRVQQDTLPNTLREIQTMSDEKGAIRLVRLFMGRGSITLLGVPYFMYFDSLRKEENARLSWNLLGTQGDSTDSGVLFIRDKRLVKSLWGKLAERGNLLALGVSVMVFLVIGFWTVIPVFGLLIGEQIKPGKPIRERFLAEARFLKKYGALETYAAVYIREISLKLKKRRGFTGEIGNSPRELAEQILAITGDGPQAASPASKNPPTWDIAFLSSVIEPKKNLRNRDFVKRIAALETILEYL